MTALMQHVERAAGRGWMAILTALELLGLPMTVALRALGARVRPQACWAAPLLIVRHGWEARLNVVQDRWASRLLDIDTPMPRILLLRELGFPQRLSTQILGTGSQDRIHCARVPA